MLANVCMDTLWLALIIVSLIRILRILTFYNQLTVYRDIYTSWIEMIAVVLSVLDVVV